MNSSTNTIFMVSAVASGIVILVQAINHIWDGVSYVRKNYYHYDSKVIQFDPETSGRTILLFTSFIYATSDLQKLISDHWHQP